MLSSYKVALTIYVHSTDRFVFTTRFEHKYLHLLIATIKVDLLEVKSFFLCLCIVELSVKF